MSKKKEIVLQEKLDSNESWTAALAQQKLFVVDAHQKWCGPCTAITGLLKRIKLELSDDLLKFATAPVDDIDDLEQYRGKCEPHFLFYGCGHLVGAVKGCNAPLIRDTIVSCLESEKKIISGDAERKVFQDASSESPELDEDIADEEEEGGEEAEAEEELGAAVPKQVTVALIKPDVVENGLVDDILAKIEEAGIEVLESQDRTLTAEEATEFYKSKSEESFFDDLIAYVTGGPCKVLVLTKGETGEGVIDLWRQIIGPFDAAVAKDEEPESLRAIYGTDATSNGLHGSSSQDEAMRELAFFYPDFSPPTYRAAAGASPASGAAEKRLQRTLALIRPDALAQHKDAILGKIHEAGFEIAMQKEVELSQEQAEAFYSEHKDEEFFEALVKTMTSGPVLALCLAHEDAVEKWRGMLGPKVVAEAIESAPDSLRAQFAVADAEINMLHGSDSTTQADAELAQLFKLDQTLAVIKPDAAAQRDDIIAKLKEAGFMISCQKDMNLSAEIAGEIYKSKEGADFYDSLIGHMTSGPTLMMVLSAENAVEKLRALAGPSDPEAAKAEAPESLRALFGGSILENAVHSPSNPDSAQEKIQVVFGDAVFNWDGTLANAEPAEGDAEEPAAAEEEPAAEEEAAAEE